MRLPDETRQLLRWVQGGLGRVGESAADTDPGEGPSPDDEPGGSADETDLEADESGGAAAEAAAGAIDDDAAGGDPSAEAAGDVTDATDEITPDAESGSPAEDADTAAAGEVDIESGLSESSDHDPDPDAERPDDDLDLADALDELGAHADDSDEDDAGDADSGHFEDLPFEDTVAGRNDRVEEYSGASPHEDIRERLRESGVAERIQQELADLFRGSRTQVQPRQNLGRPGTDVVGGRPDMRQIVRRFAGDLRVRDVFERPSPGQDDDVAVGVVLDLSSSMGQDDAEADAKAAAGAFLFGIEQFGGDTVAVSYPKLGRGVTSLMTGAYERFHWEHLDSGWPSGGTPTRTAVQDGAELLAECSADRYLLIVLTDGGARNPPATRRAVDAVRDRGREWAVVGFGYGGIQEDKLETQFGQDGYRAVDIDDLPTELVDVYREQHPAL